MLLSLEKNVEYSGSSHSQTVSYRQRCFVSSESSEAGSSICEGAFLADVLGVLVQKHLFLDQRTGSAVSRSKHRVSIPWKGFLGKPEIKESASVWIFHVTKVK
jgi:hypothetical protein